LLGETDSFTHKLLNVLNYMIGLGFQS